MAAGIAAPALAGSYLDTKIHELTPQERLAIGNPQPVQLVFQFQSYGSTNEIATELMREVVTEAVKNSGLFSEVSETPVPSGAVLNVTINNTSDPRKGNSQALVSGLTLGLAGNVITDHFICTIQYAPAASVPPLAKTAEQNIHTTIGLSVAPPPNTEESPTRDDAVFKMTRQVIGNALNALAGDRAFNSGAR